LFGEGDRLVEAGARAEMVTKFVVGRAEAGGGVEGTKPPHGVGALLDASVVLFNPVVHGAAGTMAHIRAEGLAHCAGVGVVTVGGHLLGRLPHCLQGASKEPLILPISYKDDRRRAEEILLEVANRHTVPISEMGKEALDAMQRRYNVHPADVEPKVYYRLTDNWLELTVRFVVKEHGIRDITDAMSRDILAVLETAGIGIASATYEIVGLPLVRLLTEDGAPSRPRTTRERPGTGA